MEPIKPSKKVWPQWRKGWKTFESRATPSIEEVVDMKQKPPEILETVSEAIRLKSELDVLTERVDKLKSEIQSLQKRARPVISAGWAFLLFFILAVCVCGYFVYRGWAATPDISIEFNVGEILAGAGAAIAGGAYAYKTFRGE